MHLVIEIKSADASKSFDLRIVLWQPHQVAGWNCLPGNMILTHGVCHYMANAEILELIDRERKAPLRVAFLWDFRNWHDLAIGDTGTGRYYPYGMRDSDPNRHGWLKRSCTWTVKDGARGRK